MNEREADFDRRALERRNRKFYGEPEGPESVGAALSWASFFFSIILAACVMVAVVGWILL